MKKILFKILAALSRRIIAKYQPMVIGITGSVGKTSTKEAVYCALVGVYGSGQVRRNRKNYNNEIGLPLTIIGADAPKKNIFKWLVLFSKAIAILYLRQEHYPKALILEMGVDRPGDMDHLVAIAKPHISILTTVGLSHLQYFPTPEGILREKSNIFKESGKNDFAILNHDDVMVMSLQENLYKQTQVITYGLSRGAKIQVESYVVSGRELEMQIDYKGRVYKISLHDSLGMPHVMACAAGFAAGVAAGIDPDKIVTGLQNYKSELGRLRVVPAIGRSVIIDDSYNAAPSSTRVALQELFAYPAELKIAALGDMLELGSLSDTSHREIGDILADGLNSKRLQYAILVGKQMALAVEQIKKSGYNSLSDFEIESEHGFGQRVFHFDDSFAAAKKVREIVEGLGSATAAAILVKGSQGTRMERVARELLVDQSQAEQLLVRQSPYWLRKK